MRSLSVLIVAVAAIGCGNKKQDNPAGEKAVEAVTCPAGQVSKDGACVVVVTPEKVAAVAQQQSRIDDVAKLLERADTLSAPIELLGGLRGIEAWKSLVATSDQAKLADGFVAQLDNAVKTLRTLKASLGEVSTRLGNLKGELDTLMTSTGTTKKLEDVRAQISAQVRATVEPFAQQVSDTIELEIVPLAAKLGDVAAIVHVSCLTVGKTGGDQAKALCKDTKAVFAQAYSFLDDLKDRPAHLYNELSATLVAQLDQLVDAQTKAALDAAQAKVNDALKLPPSAGTP